MRHHGQPLPQLARVAAPDGGQIGVDFGGGKSAAVVADGECLLRDIYGHAEARLIVEVFTFHGAPQTAIVRVLDQLANRHVLVGVQMLCQNPEQPGKVQLE